jgi:class 3 adenylate cyclase
VAADLSAGRPVPAEAFDSVTIFFSDIEGFTQLAAAVAPMAVVHLLNRLYTVMDHCASLFPVYKVETIGDAYMVVGGLPQPTDTHPADVADFALLVREAVALVPSPLPAAPAAPPAPVRLRIGLHTGPAVAGVVGNLMPRYCLFGDTVNTASRMESSGEAGRIHVSAPLAAALRAGGAHALAPRAGGPVEVKGKGPMETYWLLAAAEGNARAGPAAVAEALARAAALLAGMSESGLYASVLRDAADAADAAGRGGGSGDGGCHEGGCDGGGAAGGGGGGGGGEAGDEAAAAAPPSR